MEKILKEKLTRPWVHIIFGARQTGKTTLIKHILQSTTLEYNFADPQLRSTHLADPGLFRRECEALGAQESPHIVFVDEAPNVPTIFDSVQVLFDSDKTRWRFILCGSSARKLRQLGTNLLPGRSMLHHLYPLTLNEYPAVKMQQPSLIVPSENADTGVIPRFNPADIETRLMYGELPGIVSAPQEDRSALLKAYATIHLEEEIRRETAIRDWGAFVNFLRLSAVESGNPVNYSSLSREVGLSVPTIKAHYQLLQDMFVGFEIHPFTRSKKKQLLLTPRFQFFDMGIRHAAAQQRPSPELLANTLGCFFEQWVGIELWKRLNYLDKGNLYYLRLKSGMEIDYIAEVDERIIPIEVKWTDKPCEHDARHLNTFIKEFPSAREGFVVCRCEKPQRLSDTVTAIPWYRM